MRFTLKDSSSQLCYSCVESQILQNDRGKETIICHYSGGRVRVVTNVIKCNVYARIGSMDKYEANKIGWVLEKEDDKVMGFVPPKKKDDDL